MVPVVHVVVHPIDTAAHPNVGAGYRWAVMVGGVPAADLRGCANAHWQPTREAAEAEGDRNGATAVRVLHLLGMPAQYGGVQHLDSDPIPAGDDRINIV